MPLAWRLPRPSASRADTLKPLFTQSIKRLDGLRALVDFRAMKTLKLRFGSIDLELHSEDLEADLAVTRKFLVEMTGVPAFVAGSSPSAGASEPLPEQQHQPNALLQQTMNGYVARLGGDSARKLMQVAALHLALHDQKDVFSKADLLARVREAKEWKADYSNQQASNLHRMVKSNELIEKSGGMYAVPDKVLNEARGKLISE
jgi:hypothetical protein